jgi:hypothetical protein
MDIGAVFGDDVGGDDTPPTIIFVQIDYSTIVLFINLRFPEISAGGENFAIEVLRQMRRVRTGQ